MVPSQKLLETSYTLEREERALKAKRRSVARELEHFELEAQTKRRMESLTDPEKKALAQLIQAEGIESEEVVPSPS